MMQNYDPLRYSYLKLKLSLNNVVGRIIVTYVYMLQYKFCATPGPPLLKNNNDVLSLQVNNLIFINLKLI